MAFHESVITCFHIFNRDENGSWYSQNIILWPYSRDVCDKIFCSHLYRIHLNLLYCISCVGPVLTANPNNSEIIYFI